MSLGPPGEHEASDARFDYVVKHYRALLRGAISRVCPAGLGLSCEDIEQEAWVSLWRALKSEREIVSLVSYIRKVAITTTLRAVRRAVARREEALPDESEVSGCWSPALFDESVPSPYTVAERQELRQKIAAGLAQLANNRRLAVSLHLQDLTPAEIGTLLGWSEAKARNLVSRGRKDLRKALAGIGVEYQP